MTDPRLDLPPPRPPALSQPTALIQLSPALLAQLKQIAPKKQRSKLWYLLLALVVAAAGVFLAVSPAARSVVVTKARAAIARIKGQPPSPPPVAVTAPAPIPAPPVVETAIPTVAPSISVAPTASAPITSSTAKSKPTPKKSTRR